MKLGQPGIYRVPEVHHTNKTVKDGDEEKLVHDGGSIHHGKMSAFAAFAGRVHSTDEKGNHLVDVAIMVPGRPHFEWVEGVKVGSGHGEFEPETVEEPKPRKRAGNGNGDNGGSES